MKTLLVGLAMLGIGLDANAACDELFTGQRLYTVTKVSEDLRERLPEIERILGAPLLGMKVGVSPESVTLGTNRYDDVESNFSVETMLDSGLRNPLDCEPKYRGPEFGIVFVLAPKLAFYLMYRDDPANVDALTVGQYGSGRGSFTLEPLSHD